MTVPILWAYRHRVHRRAVNIFSIEEEPNIRSTQSKLIKMLQSQIIIMLRDRREFQNRPAQTKRDGNFHCPIAGKMQFVPKSRNLSMLGLTLSCRSNQYPRIKYFCSYRLVGVKAFYTYSLYILAYFIRCKKF